MKFKTIFFAAAALAASVGAQADVSGSLGRGADGSFLSLSAAGLNGGSVATLAGGTVYSSESTVCGHARR